MKRASEIDDFIDRNDVSAGKLKRKRKPPKKFIWEMPPIPKQKPPAKKQRKQFKQTFEVEDILEVQGVNFQPIRIITPLIIFRA